MPATQKNATEMAAADLEAMNAALDDFDLEGDDETIGEENNQALEASNEVLDDDALGDLELEIERTEAYASQTSTPVATVDPQAEPEKPARKGRAKKASSSTAPTRTPRDVSKVASEFFVLTGDPAKMDDAAKDAAKTATMALKPGQVKIAEKFENLFAALSVGKAPSTYVMIAFKLLDEKKTITSADVVGAYKASGLGEGTARSQSGQIMHLFATVGIADRAGQTLTLKPDSTIADRIRKLPTSAA